MTAGVFFALSPSAICPTKLVKSLSVPSHEDLAANLCWRANEDGDEARFGCLSLLPSDGIGGCRLPAPGRIR